MKRRALLLVTLILLGGAVGFNSAAPARAEETAFQLSDSWPHVGTWLTMDARSVASNRSLGLIANPSFEEGTSLPPTGWTPVGPASRMHYVEGPATPRAIEFTGADGETTGLHQPLALASNGNYTITLQTRISEITANHEPFRGGRVWVDLVEQAGRRSENIALHGTNGWTRQTMRVSTGVLIGKPTLHVELDQEAGSFVVDDLVIAEVPRIAWTADGHGVSRDATAKLLVTTPGDFVLALNVAYPDAAAREWSTIVHAWDARLTTTCLDDGRARLEWPGVAERSPQGQRLMMTAPDGTTSNVSLSATDPSYTTTPLDVGRAYAALLELDFADRTVRTPSIRVECRPDLVTPSEEQVPAGRIVATPLLGDLRTRFEFRVNPGPLPAPRHHVPDGSFEWSEDPSRSPAWLMPAGAQIVSDVSHDGSRSLRVVGLPEASRLAAINLTQGLVSGQTYSFSALVRTENISTDAETFRGARVFLRVETSRGTSFPALESLRGTNDWTPLQAQVKIDGSLRAVTLFVGVDRESGLAWFDDVRLTSGVALTWDFNEDGKPDAIGASASWVFASPNQGEVRFNVFEGSTLTSWLATRVTVQNLAPVARAAPLPSFMPAGTPLRLDGSASSDADAQPVPRNWGLANWTSGLPEGWQRLGEAGASGPGAAGVGLRIESGSNRTTVGISQPVLLYANQEYELSVRIRTEGVTATNEKWRGARVFLTVPQTTGTIYPSLGAVHGTTDWQVYTMRFRTSNVGAGSRIALVVDREQGVAEFEDLRLGTRLQYAWFHEGKRVQRAPEWNTSFAAPGPTNVTLQVRDVWGASSEQRMAFHVYSPLLGLSAMVNGSFQLDWDAVAAREANAIRLVRTTAAGESTQIGMKAGSTRFVETRASQCPCAYNVTLVLLRQTLWIGLENVTWRVDDALDLPAKRTLDVGYPGQVTLSVGVRDPTVDRVVARISSRTKEIAQVELVQVGASFAGTWQPPLRFGRSTYDVAVVASNPQGENLTYLEAFTIEAGPSGGFVASLVAGALLLLAATGTYAYRRWVRHG
jgi:hypothetical protein